MAGGGAANEGICLGLWEEQRCFPEGSDQLLMG